MFEPAPKVNAGVVLGFSPELPPKVKPGVGFETLFAVVEVFAFVVVLEELWPKVNVDVNCVSTDCPLLLLPNVNPELVLDLDASLPTPNVKPLVAEVAWLEVKPV